MKADEARDLLGVEEDDDLPAVRKAYKRAAMTWHPDKNPESMREECEARMKDVNAAYKKLEKLDGGGHDSDDEDAVYDDDDDDDDIFGFMAAIFAMMERDRDPFMRPHTRRGGRYGGGSFGGGGGGFGSGFTSTEIPGFMPGVRVHVHSGPPPRGPPPRSDSAYERRKDDEARRAALDRQSVAEEQQRAKEAAAKRRAHALSMVQKLAKPVCTAAADASLTVTVDRNGKFHGKMPLGAVWQLHYRPAIGTGAARHWQQSERTDKTEVSIGGLAPGTAYQLKARGGYTVAAAVANSATEWFSFSAEAQAKTTGAPPPRARPPPKAPVKAAPPPAPAKRADSPPRVDGGDSGDDSDGTHASVPAYEDTDDSDGEPPPLVEPELARPAPAAAPAAVGGGGPPRRAAAPAPAPRARPAPEFESHSESDSDEDAPHEPPAEPVGKQHVPRGPPVATEQPPPQAAATPTDTNGAATHGACGAGEEGLSRAQIKRRRKKAEVAAARAAAAAWASPKPAPEHASGQAQRAVPMPAKATVPLATSAAPFKPAQATGTAKAATPPVAPAAAAQPRSAPTKAPPGKPAPAAPPADAAADTAASSSQWQQRKSKKGKGKAAPAPPPAPAHRPSEAELEAARQARARELAEEARAAEAADLNEALALSMEQGAVGDAEAFGLEGAYDVDEMDDLIQQQHAIEAQLAEERRRAQAAAARTAAAAEAKRREAAAAAAATRGSHDADTVTRRRGAPAAGRSDHGAGRGAAPFAGRGIRPDHTAPAWSPAPPPPAAPPPAQAPMPAAAAAVASLPHRPVPVPTQHAPSARGALARKLASARGQAQARQAPANSQGSAPAPAQQPQQPPGSAFPIPAPVRHPALKIPAASHSAADWGDPTPEHLGDAPCASHDDSTHAFGGIGTSAQPGFDDPVPEPIPEAYDEPVPEALQESAPEVPSASFGTKPFQQPAPRAGAPAFVQQPQHVASAPRERPLQRWQPPGASAVSPHAQLPAQPMEQPRWQSYGTPPPAQPQAHHATSGSFHQPFSGAQMGSAHFGEGGMYGAPQQYAAFAQPAQPHASASWDRPPGFGPPAGFAGGADLSGFAAAAQPFAQAAYAPGVVPASIGASDQWGGSMAGANSQAWAYQQPASGAHYATGTNMYAEQSMQGAAW